MSLMKRMACGCLLALVVGAHAWAGKNNSVVVDVKIVVPPTAVVHMETESITFDLPQANAEGRASASVAVDGTVHANTAVDLIWDVDKPIGAPGKWRAVANPVHYEDGTWGLGNITIIVEELAEGQQLLNNTLKTSYGTELTSGTAVLRVQVPPSP